MSLASYAERLLNVLAKAKAGTLPEDPLFADFVERAARQIRPHHFSRHTAKEIVGQLAELWAFVNGRTGREPQVETSCHGMSCVVLTRMPDQPFIVDTIRLALKNAGATWVGGINLVMAVSRDGQGQITALGAEDGLRESLIRLSTEGITTEAAATVRKEVEGSLLLSQGTVTDFQAMTNLVDAASYRFTRLADRIPHLADHMRETAELLRWLLSDNFVFMAVITEDQRLGLANSSVAGLWSSDAFERWSPPIDDASPVTVRKGRDDSRIHRSGRLDEIRIVIPGEHNSPPKHMLIQGLFTYRAITAPGRHVPVLRKVLANILRSQESEAGSYRYKGIANVFDSLPTEFLFTTDADQILHMVERVLEAEQEQQVRVHFVDNRDTSSTFVLMALPRSQWNDALRRDIQQLLQRTSEAAAADHGVFLGRFDTMLAHWYLTGAKALKEADQEALRTGITELSTPWSVRLDKVIAESHGRDEGDELVIKYAEAFEDIYTRFSSPGRAARDIARIEALGDGQVSADVYRDDKARLSLRIFQDQDILLTDLLPVLDNLGLVVIDQYQDRVSPRGRPVVNVDTFRLQSTEALSTDAIEAQDASLTSAISAIFEGHTTDDVLNKVILRARLSWQAADMLRAYVGYARQIGLPYTLARVTELLLAQTDLVQRWWACFEARFAPSMEGDRDKAVAAADEHYSALARTILNHDQDVLFDTLFNLLDATLRTNFYRSDKPFHYLSFKVDHSKVRHLPQPAMMFEIYVHHPEVEGLHLRGGKIARGGIRWSDRQDYRREILDLVSTQMVKNVLIVPEGAKGGFFIKSDPPVGESRRAQADRLYQVLIRGMLDLTDNIVDGAVVHPPDVVFRDEDDPYLVVAADKGTAHLSDTANGLSRQYGFWLDDAFASGGSNGYDHKKVGITARGGWETVNRHFLEMGLDPKVDEFTCVGVGDPAGDVFGNGVIEHPKMKLLAAFNHRHVFIDPNPDTEKTYAERCRLFREVKGWEAYDTSLLSPGGGIFDRTAKSIELSPEIQKMLGVLKSELPVDVVLRLLLRLNVDLLWNGGIGTYVKASHETHADAGDPTNDHYRVNANELRCKVVGEGGNLGFTQAGRIEYCLRGGRMNTDAIDNSGGVDMSDHEVNLKILLSPVVRSGSLSWEDRNVLLESMTDVVAQQVLANNDKHGSQLSLDQIRSRRDPMLYSRAIDWVCRRGGVTRQTLRLPTDDDLLRRAAQGQGLTRPELAVLQAHVKMHVFKELKEADVSLVPGFHAKVLGYFPENIQRDYADEIKDHMLYRSIGMTVVTTEVVGESGALYFPMVMELTGADAATVAGAWYDAADRLGARAFSQEIDAVDTELGARYRAWIDVTKAILSLVTLWLTPGEAGAAGEDPTAFAEALARIGRMKGTALEARLDDRAAKHINRSMPKALAARIAVLGEVAVAREVARAWKEGTHVSSEVTRYMAIGEASRILPAIRSMEALSAAAGWDSVAMGILRTRYILVMRNLLDAVDVGGEVRLGLDRVATGLSRGALKELREEVAHIIGDQPQVSNLLVAEERVRGWLARNASLAN